MAEARNKLRKRLIIDRKVQGAILSQFAIICLLTTVLNFILNLGIDYFHARQEPQSLEAYIMLACLVGGILLLNCLCIWACLKLTNRLAGPIYRLKAHMEAIVAGKDMPNIALREKDYFTDLVSNYNLILAELREARAVKPGMDDAADDSSVLN